MHTIFFQCTRKKSTETKKKVVNICSSNSPFWPFVCQSHTQAMAVDVNFTVMLIFLAYVFTISNMNGITLASQTIQGKKKRESLNVFNVVGPGKANITTTKTFIT